MAIKLVNALRNFHVEDNEIEIQKVISFLINNCDYKESLIDVSLVIQDDDYIKLAEYFGNYEIRYALECSPGFGSKREIDDYMEMMMDQLIPNREPPQHAKYADVAKKLMLTVGNSEQFKTTTTNVTSESLVEEQSNEVENVFMPENNRVRKDWIYTDKAKSEDKERFKDYIEYLCKNNVSAQSIKNYIKAQEKDNILVPIKPTKQYDLLEEIGVKFKKKTFLNA